MGDCQDSGLSVRKIRALWRFNTWSGTRGGRDNACNDGNWKRDRSRCNSIVIVLSKPDTCQLDVTTVEELLSSGIVQLVVVVLGGKVLLLVVIIVETLPVLEDVLESDVPQGCEVVTVDVMTVVDGETTTTDEVVVASDMVL